MCGISGIFGAGWSRRQLDAMVSVQRHRGPDDTGIFAGAAGFAGLGHNRLSILDLSPAGHQPMANHDGSLWIVLNGEIYNYLELREELSEYPFQSRSDTEVILAAYERWGEDCLSHFIGMFAFLIWDSRARRLFAARDRFGVKPLYYHVQPDGTLLVASEIKALHAAGVAAAPDAATWATYLAYGVYEHSESTFWQDVRSVPAGHRLVWQDGRTRICCWYNLVDRVEPEPDRRPVGQVQDEYLDLLTESVRLRFRADVPVGINLSGGLDSSTLLGLVHRVQGTDSEVKAFTFTTGDPRYDETPWVEQMLAKTRHRWVECRLTAEDVPALARAVQRHQDEPFGGVPTLAYARLFEEARAEATIVLLDGQGLDEQWAGYDYYQSASNGSAGLVQGTRQRTVRPECLVPEFGSLATEFTPAGPFTDRVRNLQYRDIRYTKIPRALRFNDRVSMRASTELREPFLDHRLVELALRQPVERKIVNGTGKWLLRQVVRGMLPAAVSEAPKRPVQTPQREWLRGPLREWAAGCIEEALDARGGEWLDRRAVRAAWREYCQGRGDNSFYVWQWISLGMMAEARMAVGSV